MNYHDESQSIGLAMYRDSPQIIDATSSCTMNIILKLRMRLRAKSS